MSWTTPITWPSGAVTALQLNQQVRDNPKAKLARCQAYNSTYGVTNLIGVAPGGTGLVAFDGVLDDPLGMWGGAGQPTRITAPIAGWYRFRGVVCGSAQAPSGGYRARLSKNGVAQIDAANTLNAGSIVGEYDIQLAAGDYLELLVAVALGGSGFSWSPSFGDSTLSIIAFGLFSAANLDVEWLSP
jgi:hypothetical protein